MALMHCIVLLLTVAVVAHGSPHRGGMKHSPELRACFDVLKPEGGREAIKTTTETCVGEQDGLQATIDGLKEAAGSERGGRKGGKGRRGKHGGRGGNPIKLLEDAGNTAEAETLKKCLAREFGHLTTDGTEAFDVEGFKTSLADKSEDPDTKTNIQRGIDNCPDDSLTSFDPHTYMKCVVSYCATGEAPSTDAPPAEDEEADAEAIEP